MAQVYDRDGNVLPLDEDDVFFRKMLNLSSKTESRIASKLLHFPQPNIVSIYSVKKYHIDMELLDISHPDISTLKVDIQHALEQLHSLDVVYIDLKFDNMGYSHKDSCWKLFDFDASGIVKRGIPSKWYCSPPRYYNYNRFSPKVPSDCSLFMLDTLAYNYMFPDDSVE